MPVVTCVSSSSSVPVQAAVIPALLESTADGFLVARGGYRPRDLCVSAPTGSGKTLAFVIPVVQVSERTPNLRGGSAGREPALLTGGSHPPPRPCSVEPSARSVPWLCCPLRSWPSRFVHPTPLGQT